MKLKGKTKWIVISVLIVAVFTAVGFGAKWVLETYTWVDGQRYPQKEATLDLCGQDISLEHYNAVAERLPDCQIRWDVPFQDTRYPNDTRRIALTSLTQADIDRLDYLPCLETVDATGCQDYGLLQALQAHRPECQVLYTVTVDGQDYPQDATQVVAPHLTAEDVALMEYLPQLTAVDASGCRDYELLLSLRDTHPQWQVRYTVSIAGVDYPQDTHQITLSHGVYQELSKYLSALPELNTLILTLPTPSSQELRALREEYPQVDIHWQVEVLGKTVTDQMTELDISAQPLQSTQEAAALADYFPDLEKLIVSRGAVDNETMAAFREEMRPQYKVVWTVYCGSIAVRTDDTYFMPLQHGYTDDFTNSMARNLKYCEDMISIDIGHMPVSDITFLEYMPNLKYLILAHTKVWDITSLSTCKSLLFLELDHSGVWDYTPLLGCTALEDLNLGRTFGDPTPITKMTWLKHLWWVFGTSSTEQIVRAALPDTEIMFHASATVANGWRKLDNYYAMRDELHMYYMGW